MNHPIRRILAAAAAIVAVALALGAAVPASAQFYGQPGWISDPTNVCTYPGRAGCPFVDATEPLPIGATAITADSGVVTAATATATLTGVAAKTTYLQGFLITGGGATGASLVTCTITGLVTGTLHFIVPVVAGATLGVAPLGREFPQALPSSAVNTSIVVSCPTFGSGNNGASINAWGYTR